MSAVSDVIAESKAASAQISETNGTSSKNNKTKISGRVIGKPELSEKAAKYYENLKQKYFNMDFILVSEDMKNIAQAQAGSFANPNKMVVLIDEEKIERMAEDENYRKQYEAVIANAASGISQLKDKLTATKAKVKGYGVKVNDYGMSSYFAVIDKSQAAQKKRIEKKAEEKKEAKKAEEKKARKEEREERLKKDKTDKTDKYEVSEDNEDLVTITASSIDELINKVNDTLYASMSDYVQTQQEKNVGQNYDFSI